MNERELGEELRREEEFNREEKWAATSRFDYNRASHMDALERAARLLSEYYEGGDGR